MSRPVCGPGLATSINLAWGTFLPEAALPNSAAFGFRPTFRPSGFRRFTAIFGLVISVLRHSVAETCRRNVGRTRRHLATERQHCCSMQDPLESNEDFATDLAFPDQRLAGRKHSEAELIGDMIAECVLVRIRDCLITRRAIKQDPCWRKEAKCTQLEVGRLGLGAAGSCCTGASRR